MDKARNELMRAEYIARINKVQDYIESNLSEDFTLLKLSQIANFSPYHFHRIFYMMTGETLFQFIQRIRLEKSVFLLVSNPQTPITQIALECGFANQASFAKAFKKHFNVSASKIRAEKSIYRNDNLNADSNLGKVYEDILRYNNGVRNIHSSAKYVQPDTQSSVEIKTISEMSVVYIRHTGPYKQDAVLLEKLYYKLYKWADEKSLINNDTKWITLFHDSTDLTDDDKLRISICMTAPEDTKVDGAVGKLVVAGGKYAVGHFQLDDDEFQKAWSFLCGHWLPGSGYQPDDRLCFELYSYSSAENHEKKHIVDIYIPIRAL
ncbi:MAG: AraC family transcriptional regulator [Bacillota bacterium]